MLEIYQNKQEIFDEIETLLLSLDVYDANIINLQKLFIFDKDSSYPINISCNYDVVLNNIGHTDYKIIAKLLEKDINNFNINILFKWRRKGLLRNRIEKIE